MKEFKSFLIITFTVLSLFFIMPLSVQAAESGDFSYDIVNDKAVIIKYNYNDNLGNVSVLVPETLGGYPVTYISNSAFANCRYLTSVNLPSSVTGIGDFAFANCRFLSKINLQETAVKTIGARAFESCYTLTSINLPSSVTDIGFGAFRFSSLTEIVLPNGIKNISDSAFEGCIKMKTITLPESIDSIGVCAFAGCSDLETINALPMVAPQLDSTSFEYVPSTAVLYLPYGSKQYDSDPWIQWKQIESMSPSKCIDNVFPMCVKFYANLSKNIF